MLKGFKHFVSTFLKPDKMFNVYRYLSRVVKLDLKSLNISFMPLC